MTRYSKNQRLLQALRNGANSFDHQEGGISPVVVAPIQTDNKLFTLGGGQYTPSAKVQVQGNILTLYFTEASGVYTASNAATVIGDGLTEQLPVFLFANGDFSAGYASLKANFPLTQWTYNKPFAYEGLGGYFCEFSQLDATVLAQLRLGDIVLPYTVTIAGPTNYVALRIIRFSNVPYSNLLASSNSNRFKVKMIRYTVPNTTAGLAQFANPIFTADETMFGKFTKDSVDPESYQNPEQNQPQIVDVEIKVGIDKQKGLATTVNPDVVAFRWNFFIDGVEKV